MIWLYFTVGVKCHYMAENGREPELEFPIVQDPEVSYVLEQARDYQKDLDLQPNASDEDIESIISTLDGEWPYFREQMNVSGRVQTSVIGPDYDESGELTIKTLTREDGSQDLCNIMLNDQPLVSLGFTYEKVPMHVAGEEIGVRTVLKLLFGREVQLNLPDGDNWYQLAAEYTAKIDDVVMESESESAEFSEIKTREYFPELADTLDDLTDQHRTVAQRFLAMRDIIEPRPDYIDQNALQSVENYTNEIIGTMYEREPYIAVPVEEALLFHDPDGDTECDVLTPDPLLIHVLGLRVRPVVNIYETDENYAIEHDLTQFEYRLSGVIASHDFAHDNNALVEIRLRDIRALQNIRQLVYSQTDGEHADDTNEPPANGDS